MRRSGWITEVRAQAIIADELVRAIRVALLAGVLVAASWPAMAGQAEAATVVTGIDDPTRPLVIDPGSPAGAVEASDLNFYTGSNVFQITSMPDTRRIDQVTIGPIARAASCAGKSVHLRIYEAPAALQPSTVVSQSLAMVALPATPENMTFDMQPVTLRAGRAYIFNLKHGSTNCVTGRRLTWSHNENQVDAGAALCSFMPFQSVSWYRMWHVYGYDDMPVCPYGREPANFDPLMPTGWLSVQLFYPNWLVDFVSTVGPPLTPPVCDNGEAWGKLSEYWKPHPTLPDRHWWTCEYTRFPEPFPGVVPDGWYYAGPWDPPVGGPRDMHLELHPIDYESLVQDHVPAYAFDLNENFYPQKASAFTEHWEYAAPPDGYVQSTYWVNILLNGAGEEIAAAGSPGPPSFAPILVLGVLGDTYWFSPSEQPASSVDDYIDARGGDESTYSADSARMYSEGHDDIVYTRVIYDPADDKLWIQYWSFYYYNSFSYFGAGMHEGDWEMVQVGFSDALQPTEVTFASHDRGYGCAWADIEVAGALSQSPVVYVAARSHAAYPHAGETALEWGAEDSHHGDGLWDIPPMELIDGQTRWTGWRGRWGASGGTFASPANPSQQGDKWDHPSAFHDDHLNPIECAG